MKDGETGKVVSTIASVVMTGAALIVMSLVIHREFVRTGHAAESTSRTIDDWQRFLDGGHVIGASDALVNIVVFADFQCSFCAVLHAEVSDMIREYPTALAVTFRHAPLHIHAAAVQAALASECAASQQLFAPYADLLFAEQQWIGVRDWGSFAFEAGVPDTARFTNCLRDHTFVKRVRADMAAARELGVVATPTFIIDGMLVTGPSPDEFRRQVRRAMKWASVAEED